MTSSSELVSRVAQEPGRVQRWLRIRHGEGRLMLWLGMLALIFGIFSATYLVGGTAILLVSVEAETLRWLLPLLYLAAGLGAFVTRWWFSELTQRLAPRRLAFITLGLAFFLVLLLGGALAWSGDASDILSLIASGWFVSVASMLAVVDLLFWALVKRSFGITRVQRLSRVITGLTDDIVRDAQLLPRGYTCWSCGSNLRSESH